MNAVPFYVVFRAPITVYGRSYTVQCTASPRPNQVPAVLWIDDIRDLDETPPYLMLPKAFWDEVERQLSVGGPVKDAYDAAFAVAAAPHWSVAAE